MKNNKFVKAMMIVVAMVLVCVLSVMGTLAYLTSQTAQVTNTFTVGKVEITLDETDVDVYGVKDGETRVIANEYKLIPNHTYVKDPIVHVAAGSEESWLFVKVVDGIEAIQDDATVAAQMTDNGWTLVDDETEIWAYNTKVNAGDNITVFENFKIKADADVSNYNGNTITVMAYAVQADGFSTSAAAWAAAPCNFVPKA